MSLTFESYWPLALLPALFYLWWVRGRTATSLTRRHLKVLSVARASVVLLLVLALTRPHVNRPGTGVSTVFLLDVSRSIAPEFLSAAIQWSGEAVDRGAPEHARFIGFAKNSRMVERASELPSLAVYDGGAMESGATPPPPGAIDQSGTNIERAVRQALASFAPASLKRLVLVTDGHETEGSVLSLLPDLEAAGVRVFTVPAAVRAEGDSWIERIEVPPDVRAGEAIDVAVVVFSRAAKKASVS
ncbi:MAG TPA: vWA domain-containing protein, partial [Vicinamibacteria bacterium]